MLSMHITTWGSRAGADANDDWRLIRLPPYGGHAAAGPDDQFKTDINKELGAIYNDEQHPLLPQYGDDS